MYEQANTDEVWWVLDSQGEEWPDEDPDDRTFEEFWEIEEGSPELTLIGCGICGTLTVLTLDSETCGGCPAGSWYAGINPEEEVYH